MALRSRMEMWGSHSHQPASRSHHRPPYPPHVTGPGPSSTTQLQARFDEQAWATASSVDLRSPPNGDRLQPWQSSASLIPARQPAPRPDAQALYQNPSFCPVAAARLQDLLWELDGDERGIDGTEEFAQGIILEDRPNIRATRGERERSRSVDHSHGRTRTGLINFSKSWKYANSRLPPHMPPMVVYMPTWRLFCVAARASVDVYNRPHGTEKEHFVDAAWRHGTKAMVLKSSPIDDKNLIVFAIRGSQMTFADWSVNFRPEPKSPEGFLDDPGNNCHAGFLAVAKAMVQPVAARLRQVLEQDPSRTSSSLVITGHSAGGAVAALLYAHILSVRVESELTILADCFKRVHCITFGAPPVTLLPLQKPACKRHEKSIFMSFANEGDPVIRADKKYILSLAKLLAAPAPGSDNERAVPLPKDTSRQMLKGSRPARKAAPYWPVPSATLSNAGRVTLLRERPGRHSRSTVEAVSTNDDQLRHVVFGDPAMHSMVLYKQRIDDLAIAAVTGDDVR